MTLHPGREPRDDSPSAGSSDGEVTMPSRRVDFDSLPVAALLLQDNVVVASSGDSARSLVPASFTSSTTTSMLA